MSFIQNLVNQLLGKGETKARCETCGVEFLNVNTGFFLRNTQTIRGRPDKWLVYALEHFYENPDHELGCYANGVRNMQPNFELTTELAKTNPEEIAEFKIKVEELPF